MTARFPKVDVAERVDGTAFELSRSERFRIRRPGLARRAERFRSLRVRRAHRDGAPSPGEDSLARKRVRENGSRKREKTGQPELGDFLAIFLNALDAGPGGDLGTDGAYPLQ